MGKDWLDNVTKDKCMDKVNKYLVCVLLECFLKKLPYRMKVWQKCKKVVKILIIVVELQNKVWCIGQTFLSPNFCPIQYNVLSCDP